MANHSITINNTLRTFALAPSDKWGEYNWNAFKWGEGTNDVETKTVHIIDAGSVTPTSTMSPSAYFFPPAISDSLALSSSMNISVAYVISISIANTLSIVGDMYRETLSDGSGYDYVFASDASNFENKVTSTYVAATSPSTTWTAQSGTTATWSAS